MRLVHSNSSFRLATVLHYKCLSLYAQTVFENHSKIPTHSFAFEDETYEKVFGLVRSRHAINSVYLISVVNTCHMQTWYGG